MGAEEKGLHVLPRGNTIRLRNRIAVSLFPWCSTAMLITHLIEVELRIWPLPDFQTRARGMIADAALVLHLQRSQSEWSSQMCLTPNEIIAPLSHVHGGRGAAGRVRLVPRMGNADKPAPAAANGPRRGRKV